MGFMNGTYIVNNQLREAWAQFAGMMLVPGCKEIGTLTNGVPRRRTMLWAEPQQLILDVRWAEFVRNNFMWTFLLVQPRSDVEAQSATYMAFLRMAAPLNGSL